MHLGPKNRLIDYYMKDSENRKQILETVELEKDLGVNIDNKLNFSQHIALQVNKGNRLVGLIRRNFLAMNKTSFSILYKAIVRPILEYGSCVWSPYLKKNIRLLEQVQRRATRLVLGTKEMDYEQRLRFIGLPTLEYRRIRRDVIEIFKILSNNPNDSIFQLNESRTRGNNLKICKQSCKLNIRKYSFSLRTVNNWNSLPISLVNSSSINSFKSSLNMHWKQHPIKFNASCY